MYSKRKRKTTWTEVGLVTQIEYPSQTADVETIRQNRALSGMRLRSNRENVSSVLMAHTHEKARTHWPSRPCRWGEEAELEKESIISTIWIIIALLYKMAGGNIFKDFNKIQCRIHFVCLYYFNLCKYIVSRKILNLIYTTFVKKKKKQLKSSYNSLLVFSPLAQRKKQNNKKPQPAGISFIFWKLQNLF